MPPVVANRLIQPLVIEGAFERARYLAYGATAMSASRRVGLGLLELSLLENGTALPQPRRSKYEFARCNALRHGGEQFRVLLKALVAEHRPEGPTEEQSSRGAAGAIWRKRRLRLGEALRIIAL